jgi:NADPH2:quinone reductase
MTPLVNRCYRLRQRPEGLVSENDLEFLEEPVPPVGPGQALVRVLLLSLDPSNRIWMSDARSYLPPVPLDAVMRGIGIAEVIESQRADMQPGDLVSGFTGWQDYYLVDDAANELPFTVLPSPLPVPLTALLGPLGHTGITAYLGVEDIADLKPGETMVVSAAAGAVGSVAGQIGKARGARVVGLAGSPEKCRHVVDELGFDACVNYKDPDWRDQLDAATPDGVDVDFENVGGEIMDHVLGRLNVGARIPLCGMISQYTAYGTGSEVAGQREIGQLIMQRAVMRGFLVLDHPDRFPEAIEYLGGLLAQGKLKYDETVIEGLENARAAVNDLFRGSNVGKLLIKIADPSPAAGADAAGVGAAAAP